MDSAAFISCISVCTVFFLAVLFRKSRNCCSYDVNDLRFYALSPKIGGNTEGGVIMLVGLLLSLGAAGVGFYYGMTSAGLRFPRMAQVMLTFVIVNTIMLNKLRPEADDEHYSANSFQGAVFFRIASRKRHFSNLYGAAYSANDVLADVRIDWLTAKATNNRELLEQWGAPGDFETLDAALRTMFPMDTSQDPGKQTTPVISQQGYILHDQRPNHQHTSQPLLEESTNAADSTQHETQQPASLSAEATGTVAATTRTPHTDTTAAPPVSHGGVTTVIARKSTDQTAHDVGFDVQQTYTPSISRSADSTQHETEQPASLSAEATGTVAATTPSNVRSAVGAVDESVEIGAQVSTRLAQWLYLDDSGAEQGPFSTENIQQWLAAGHLTADRKVKRVGSGGEFVALSSVIELLGTASASNTTATPPVWPL
jgi:hypothetical protein